MIFVSGATARRRRRCWRPRGSALGFEVDVVAPVTRGRGAREQQRRARVRSRQADFAQVRRWLGPAVFDDRPGGAGQPPGTQLWVSRRRTCRSSGGVRPCRAFSPSGCMAPRRHALPGVASLGTRPTVDGGHTLLEAHVFDFSGDLYGREIEVEFVAKLREEEHFPSLDAWSRRCTRMRRRRDNDGLCMAERLRMTDYKSTINLPQTAFPMKADLARREPAMVAALGGARHLRQAASGRARPPAVRAARRAAVRQRRHPHRPRRQQDPQGHHRQVALPRWLRCALHPRLGLSRPADRAAGGEEARPPGPEARCRGVSRRLPGLRAGAGESAARGLQAPGRARGLGPSLSHDGAALRGAADCVPSAASSRTAISTRA